MKKEFSTRLSVKKQTVVNLENAQMNDVNAGGISGSICYSRIWPCDTINYPCVTYSKCNTACNSNPCC